MTKVMEKRLLACIVAVCTYFMGRLAILHAQLQPPNENAGVKFHELVALLFSFPVFELHNALFKVVYLSNCRRLILLRSQNELVRSGNFPLEFNSLSGNYSSVSKLNECYRHLTCGLDRTNGKSKTINHKNHSSLG